MTFCIFVYLLYTETQFFFVPAHFILLMDAVYVSCSCFFFFPLQRSNLLSLASNSSFINLQALFFTFFPLLLFVPFFSLSLPFLYLVLPSFLFLPFSFLSYIPFFPSLLFSLFMCFFTFYRYVYKVLYSVDFSKIEFFLLFLVFSFAV